MRRVHLAGDAAKRHFPHFNVFHGVDPNCFGCPHGDKTDKGTGIIGLMLECVWPSASSLIPPAHSLDLEAGL